MDLVNVLNTQHQEGRALTDSTMQLATAAAKDSGQRAKLRHALYQFVRMYEPHEAREDTVLFPAFRRIVSKNEYDSLGEEFERKENQMFHGDGFEKNVDAVAKLEKHSGFTSYLNLRPPSEVALPRVSLHCLVRGPSVRMGLESLLILPDGHVFTKQFHFSGMSASRTSKPNPVQLGR